jgi:UDP-glucose 4-epimerase
MKSLVTGGAGFIGSHIVDRLLELGHEVIIIDNESSTCHHQFYFNPSAKYFKLDIIDYEKTRHLYDGVDYVFHCAAEARIQNAVTIPLLTVSTNVVGTATVLQCSKEANVKKVIYSSTSSAYGLNNNPPLKEDMPEDCLNIYSVSKVAGEKLCAAYHKFHGLKTICFRYFNVYGPREPVKGPYALVVGKFLRQYRSSEPLTIVPDGNQRRDFTFVSDIVEANILAMQIDHKHYGEVFNVGTGRNYSILELAAMISKNTVMVDLRPAEAYITLADNLKIKNVLGWEARFKLEDYIKNELNRSM